MYKTIFWLAFTALAGCAHEPAFPPSQGHIDATQQIKSAVVPGNIPKRVKNIAFLPPPKPKVKEQTYRVVVNEVPVREILFALARESKLNVDIHPGIMGNVTINAVDQTLPAILDRLSRQVDLRYMVEGNVLSITPDLPTLRTYKVNYVNMERDTTSAIGASAQIATSGSAAAASSGSSSSSSGSGNGSSTTVSNKSKNNFWELLAENVRTILKTTKSQAANAEEKAAKAEAIRVSQEQRLKQVEAVSRAGAGAEKLFQEAFRSQPTNFESRDDVIINPVAGTVTVMATGRQQAFIQQYIDTVVSSAERQVLIEATIVEVELSDEYKTGVDWQRLSRGEGLKGVTFQQHLMGGLLGNNNIGSPSSTPPGAGVVLGYSNAFISAAVKMLESFGNTKVLSSPKMMVMNNQTSILKVVDNLVYFTVDSQISQSTVTGANNLKSFTTTPHTVPIGVVMSVTPQINENGKVTLNVRPTITDTFGDDVQDPNPDLATDVPSRIPQIRVREMESVMQVSSGETAVLGGLMQDKIIKNKGGVAGLSNIPVLGRLFSAKNELTRKSELVIFLRPTVIPRASLESEGLMNFRQYLPDQLPVITTDEPAN